MIRNSGKRARSAAERKVRTVGMLFHVVDVGGDAVVLADVADAVEMHLFVAGRAAHAVAVDHPVQPLVKGGAALRAAHPHPCILDFFFVRIVHGGRPLAPEWGKRVDKMLPRRSAVSRSGRWSYTLRSWLAAESPPKPRPAPTARRRASISRNGPSPSCRRRSSARSRTPMASCGCAARSPASRGRRRPATAISASRTTRRCWKA